jgi:hypothetical protein
MGPFKISKKQGSFLPRTARRGATFILAAGILLAAFHFVNSQHPSAGPISRQGPAVAGVKPWQAPRVPANYRSPGNLHKVVVYGADQAAAKLFKEIRPFNTYYYLGRKLYCLSTAELDKLSIDRQRSMRLRDDFNLIRLRGRYFDATVPIPAVPETQRQIVKNEEQLHLVQFVGPVQGAWLQGLKRLPGVTVVDHFPENAVLVWADKTSRDGIEQWYVRQYFVQWHGPFHPAYKLHPSLDLTFAGDVLVTVQLFTHKNVSASVTAIKAAATEVLRDSFRIGQYTNLRLKIAAAKLESVASREDVINVEPWIEPSLSCERQDQVVAGNLNAAGTGPSGTGYLAWLTARGFSANFNFIVDVTDDGFDRGDTSVANIHPDFLDASGHSRVAYVRRVSGTTVSEALDSNCSGHGTINASIVGGRNTTLATDPNIAYYADGGTYRFGLGVAPFVKVGATKILDPWSNPDYSTIIDTAYSSGARISSNSWASGCATPHGCCNAGILGDYTATSQEYDGLVRDARSSAVGNQEMVIVFAAANHGACVNEQLGNEGSTAKNTIVVGACENDNQTGVNDGCGEGNAGANNINDVADFSSAGPTQDNRVKPDIMAPGTHIFGVASQAACFNGSGVCGSATNDGALPAADAYYPPDPNAADTRDQNLYTWSSGTSHACPAVAGGAALLRQWFLDHGHPAPSPAMTKAYLVNSAAYMNGARANDNLPSNTQGMGRMNLGMVFDNTPRLVFDQVKVCHKSEADDASEVFTVTGTVSNNTMPFRVTLAWTDDRGTPGAGAMLKNDLDLEVQVGGNFYRGNNFTHGVSNPGAVADPPDDRNNLESVFLPAGTTGNFTVTVRPSDINADGVPGNGDATDQDFAIVIYNGELPARNPVDIMLVLDHSGSMADIAPGGTMPKIDLLKDAVELFIRTWEPFSIAQDRLGIVYFNNTIVRFPNQPVVQMPFQANAASFIDNVRAITPSMCTALGGGILNGLWGFDNLPSHQRHIIVFTNGMQNCSPMVTDVGGSLRIVYDPNPPCCESGVPGINVNIADYDVKAVHTIGTGVSGETWTTLLSSIAAQTGGTNHFTTTPDEDLEDYFLETLVQALRVDPVEQVKKAAGTINRTDASIAENFILNGSTRKATFAISWRGDRRLDAITCDLIAPDGTVIPASLQTVKKGVFYRIVSVSFPLSVGGRVVNPSGTWKVALRQSLQAASASYKIHLIVDEADIQYRIEIPSRRYATGDTIPLSCWVQSRNRTLTGVGSITATIGRPELGFGSFLSKHSVSKRALDSLVDLSGDKFAGPAAKKAHLLVNDNALRAELTRAKDSIVFYDDGLPEHGDVKAGDGLYSSLYANTTCPGVYDLRISIDGSGPAMNNFRRVEQRSVTVGVRRFDMTASAVTVKKERPVGDTAVYSVSLKPVDSYKNLLGPGSAVTVVIAPAGKQWGPAGRSVLLNDNLDGSYSGLVKLTPSEQHEGSSLLLDVNGQQVSALAPAPGPAMPSWLLWLLLILVVIIVVIFIIRRAGH